MSTTEVDGAGNVSNRFAGPGEKHFVDLRRGAQSAVAVLPGSLPPAGGAGHDEVLVASQLS